MYCLDSPMVGDPHQVVGTLPGRSLSFTRVRIRTLANARGLRFDRILFNKYLHMIK